MANIGSRGSAGSTPAKYPSLVFCLPYIPHPLLIHNYVSFIAQREQERNRRVGEANAEPTTTVR